MIRDEEQIKENYRIASDMARDINPAIEVSSSNAILSKTDDLGGRMHIADFKFSTVSDTIEEIEEKHKKAVKIAEDNGFVEKDKSRAYIRGDSWIVIGRAVKVFGRRHSPYTFNVSVGALVEDDE